MGWRSYGSGIVAMSGIAALTGFPGATPSVSAPSTRISPSPTSPPSPSWAPSTSGAAPGRASISSSPSTKRHSICSIPNSSPASTALRNRSRLATARRRWRRTASTPPPATTAGPLSPAAMTPIGARLREVTGIAGPAELAGRLAELDSNRVTARRLDRRPQRLGGGRTAAGQRHASLACRGSSASCSAATSPRAATTGSCPYPAGVTAMVQEEPIALGRPAAAARHARRSGTNTLSKC